MKKILALLIVLALAFLGYKIYQFLGYQIYQKQQAMQEEEERQSQKNIKEMGDTIAAYNQKVEAYNQKMGKVAPKLDKEKTMVMFDFYKKSISAQRAFYKKHGSYADTFAKLDLKIPENIFPCYAKPQKIGSGGAVDCLRMKNYGNDDMVFDRIKLLTGSSYYDLEFENNMDFNLGNGFMYYGNTDIECSARTKEAESLCEAFGGKRDPSRDGPSDLLGLKAYRISF